MIKGIATLACLLAFLGVVWWAYGGRRRSRFEEASRIPLEDEEASPASRSRADETAENEQ